MLSQYGFVLDADYEVTKRAKIDGKIVQTWVCPYYSKWKDMAGRCYTKSSKGRSRDYRDVIVCEEWKTFSNFKSWMQSQDWEAKCLDKDILGNGKVYSPLTCCFVSVKINNFILEKSKGNLTGSVYDKRRNKYQSHCKNPETGVYEGLGRYNLEVDAHIIWLKKKTQHLSTFILPLIGRDDVKIAIHNHYYLKLLNIIDTLKSTNTEVKNELDYLVLYYNFHKHLNGRGLTYTLWGKFFIDYSREIITFPLWTTNGKLVGYQRYDWRADKLRNNSTKGKYYTYRDKNILSCWGVDCNDLTSTEDLFVVEGVWDAISVLNTGRRCVAVLSNNPQNLKVWFRTLPCKTIALCDGDKAGKMLSKVCDEAVILPEGVDCNDMALSELDNYLKENL